MQMQVQPMQPRALSCQEDREGELVSSVQPEGAKYIMQV